MANTTEINIWWYRFLLFTAVIVLVELIAITGYCVLRCQFLSKEPGQNDDVEMNIMSQKRLDEIRAKDSEKARQSQEVLVDFQHQTPRIENVADDVVDQISGQRLAVERKSIAVQPGEGEQSITEPSHKNDQNHENESYSDRVTFVV